MLNPSIERKLEGLVERYQEVQALLGEPDVISDQNRFRALSREYSQLEEVVGCFEEYRQNQDDQAAAKDMAEDDDAEMREMAAEELKQAKEAEEDLENRLQLLLLPKDPNDDRSCYLEIRCRW